MFSGLWASGTVQVPTFWQGIILLIGKQIHVQRLEDRRLRKNSQQNKNNNINKAKKIDNQDNTIIMVKIFPMTRFAMSHPSRIHGLIAVNPTSSKASPALGMIKVFVFLFVFADQGMMKVSSYFDIH